MPKHDDEYHYIGVMIRARIIERYGKRFDLCFAPIVIRALVSAEVQSLALGQCASAAPSVEHLKDYIRGAYAAGCSACDAD